MKTDNWMSCDGAGNPNQHFGASRSATQDAIFSRRSLLSAATLAMLGLTATRTMGQVVVGDGAAKDILVVVFLRGGADGLNLLAPYADAHYHDARPTLALNAPGKGGAGVIKVDDRFGLHPSFAPLRNELEGGRMALVHACGSGDQTRSHFEAMSAMERGIADAKGGMNNGWIARYLAANPGSSSPIRALALGGLMPTSLKGSTSALAVQSLLDFNLQIPEGAGSQDAWMKRLLSAYSGPSDVISASGRATLQVLDRIRAATASDQSKNRKKRTDSDLAESLDQISMLIKADIGLEVACLDYGGWDTHVAQGQTAGWMPTLINNLSLSLAGFLDGLGEYKSRVTVIVQTEFGRRLAENSSLGTDHGRGGVLMLLSDHANAGKVVGDWPGLDKTQLDEVGDLRVVNDYRAVLAEVLAKRCGAENLNEVFPGADLSKHIGVIRS